MSKTSTDRPHLKARVQEDKVDFTVAIIGRPNVGKSTLFNRFLGRKRSLVHNLPGVTRDRIVEKTNWYTASGQRHIALFDTGGIGEGPFSDEIKTQVQSALTEADVALWVVDGKTGIHPEDDALFQHLCKLNVGAKIPLWVVVNKIDTPVLEPEAAVFYRFGFDQVFAISAEHDRGVEDLKDALALKFQKAETLPEEAPVRELPRVAIVGRPNVGKSTFVNAVLGENRMIVSPIAGTTIDAVETIARIGDFDCALVDTAGMRRKAKTEQGVEVLSVVQTRKALEDALLALLILDAEVGVHEQDEKIAGLIEEAGCGVVLVVNKWDLQKKNKNFTKEEAAERIRSKMRFLEYAPILFISAKERRGIGPLGDLLGEILRQRDVKIGTHELTEFIKRESEVHNPANAKFYLSHQVSRHPPTFVCHVSDPEKVHYSLRRHLVRAVRATWGYMGNPVRLLFKKGQGRSSRKLTGSRKKYQSAHQVNNIANTML